jgi:hypothetical protein
MGEIGAPACLLLGDVLVHANAAGEAAPAGDC